ncbi:MAG: glutamine-hydrolyzing carbamoyl-phosphate synthase small subunit [Spirochaetia bacterium]|jgi:carbamoyl-phosphate synthase small subunit|nr:glutamine-hydrolyzing carbamoyl-phosphate synthase small subunit [Spirochaetia bacterium]
MPKTCFLILEDGTEFKGKSFGCEDAVCGEIVFNTSMSGYQEILTDPSYNGQIITMTYPMIGNYGVNPEDVESSKVQASGFVVKEYSKSYSNFRAVMPLSDYLVQSGVPAIEGVDTRKLTKIIRNRGAMRAGIFFEQKGALETLLAHPQMAGLDLASGVSCGEPYVFSKRENAPQVAVFDFGVKTNILRLLDKAGFSVKVYPAKTSLRQALDEGASAVFLSNGPGDPEAVTYAADLVRDIAREKIPAFGICLGHQIIGLGLGALTYKLKFGHRGANQPVRNFLTGNIEISSQNHGFAVSYDSMKNMPDIELTHINLNDNTVEGLRHKTLPIISVQHHPEASPGPHDALYLFEQFYAMAVKA